jgi:hypothetical protein
MIEDKQEMQADIDQWLAVEGVVRGLLSKYPGKDIFLR